MQVDPDAFLLTRGQWLVDKIVWPTSGRFTEEYAAGCLKRYLSKMDGRTELIDRLQRARARSTANPRYFWHLKAFARARQALEAHIEQLEVANDMRYPLRGGTPSVSQARKWIPRGWSATRSSKNRGGTNRWRLSLTSTIDGRPRQVGTFGSRAEAEQEGIRIIAELRGEAT